MKLTTPEANLSLKHGYTKALLEQVRALIEYRSRVGALGFQLEKADDHIGVLERLLEQIDEVDAALADYVLTTTAEHENKYAKRIRLAQEKGA